jgi:quinol monooxygenase YgiN
VIHATTILVAPPSRRQEVLQALRATLGPTRVEPGCQSCRLYEDVEEEGKFALVEEWATRPDFERRLRSETYRLILVILELSAEPPEVRFHAVADAQGMEAVHAARA